MEKKERLLATFSEKERQRIIGQFKIPANKVIVWDDEMPCDIGLIKEIGVDNAEWLIQRYFRNNVSKVWMTGEYESPALKGKG